MRAAGRVLLIVAALVLVLVAWNVASLAGGMGPDLASGSRLAAGGVSFIAARLIWAALFGGVAE